MLIRKFTSARFRPVLINFWGKFRGHFGRVACRQMQLLQTVGRSALKGKYGLMMFWRTQLFQFTFVRILRRGMCQISCWTGAIVIWNALEQGTRIPDLNWDEDVAGLVQEAPFLRVVGTCFGKMWLFSLLKSWISHKSANNMFDM